jgi:hypothetical protein
METKNRQTIYVRLFALAMIVALALVPAQPGRTEPQSPGVDAAPALAEAPTPALQAFGGELRSRDFDPAAEQGFGDRQNGIPWSMVWWRGKLYVGTARAAQCVQVATLATYFKFIHYPPFEPDIRCTRKPEDLPLQAEIWRWTPLFNRWDRVFQSPEDVPIPGHPFKRVARDIGFRSMIVFDEPDGTEALYVGGVSSRSINPGVPPPRILRSTDGEHFLPVPQRKGTFLGDISANGFRSLTAYNGRLYVIGSEGLLGQGPLLEATDPAKGNNNFRQVTSDQMTLFELSTFNGYLYLGSGNRQAPFTVWKTDTKGQLPYTFIPVLTHGGYLQPRASNGVVSMHVFRNRLYIGTDRPAELYRINPDNSWDLIAGAPRRTPRGRKYPLSGMGAGFDWSLNIHMWRMTTFDNVLYVGTMDRSTRMRTNPIIGRLIERNMGFDLYASRDGAHFSMITRNGLGDKFNVGLRNFVPTPYGLFVGAANHYYGLNIWRTGQFNVRAASGAQLVEALAIEPQHRAYLPFIRTSSGVAGDQRLEIESRDRRVILSWNVPPGAPRFHILRADFAFSLELLVAALDLEVPDIDPDGWIPGTFREIGQSTRGYFEDKTVRLDQEYQYYVVADDGHGNLSQASNLVRAPSLSDPVTFTSLKDTLLDWSAESQAASQIGTDTIIGSLAAAQALVAAGDLDRAQTEVQSLLGRLDNQPALLDEWRVEDLRILLDTLERRINLARLGVISRAALLT